MSLITINYMSQALMKWTEMTVIVPNDLSEPLKVLYLLHGDSQDHTTYTRETAIEQLAYKYNIMAVCLNGDKFYWTNMAKALGNYEDHVIESVNYIDKLFPTSKDRKDRFIQGLSMGGYGAVKIGLKYSSMFSSIVSASGAIDIEEAFRICLADLKNNPGDDKIYDTVFGDLRDEDNNYFLAKKYGRNVRMFFHVGNKDFIRVASIKFHEFLEDNSIEHKFEYNEGDHNFDYWNRHLENGIKFHLNKY